jgi:hypothetical protein
MDLDSCYATGDILANSIVGGLFGNLDSDLATPCIVTDCYAWGDVTANTNYAGGFVAVADDTGTTFVNCYSVGLVTNAGATTGGFDSDSHVNTTFTSCYWDTDTSGWATTDGTGIEGETTTLMKTKTTFTGWDFDTIWLMAGTVLWNDTSLNLGANSVTVIPGTTEDEVWVTVSRAINSTLVRYIERMKPRVWGTSQHDCFFVDSGLSYDSTATTTFTGLGHLEGETVAILGDGAVFPTQTVTNGTVTLTESVSVCHIGLPFTYKVKPMRMDQSYNGTSKGSIKKITEAVISFYETLNAQYGDGTTTYDIKWRGTEPYTTPPALYTGDKVVVADGGFDVEDPFEISGSEPLPCTVRCIIPRLEVTGR